MSDMRIIISGGGSGGHIFPAVAIALPKVAMTVKMLRGSLIDESLKDYARTAYSRGNNTNGVLYRHILKNAIIPVITFLGMALADMIAGSIVIEQVFSIPGISRILLTSISNRDYPVVEAIIMGIAMIVIVVNFLVDVIYRIVDPRIGLEDE
jgi:ABC-type dipeptide/oligopeptide/nickel transport system permease component